jgi:hypothetical protein
LYRKPRLLFSSKSWKLENEVFVDIIYLKPIFLFLIKIMKTQLFVNFLAPFLTWS